MKSRPLFAASAALAGLLLTPAARASTGICDSNPPTSTDACINQILSGAQVKNEVFRDALGHDAEHLPVYGKLINPWPGCPDLVTATTCAGQSNPPYDCPGQYTCGAATGTVATANSFLEAVDRRWWQPCRLANPNFVTINGVECPDFASGCITDGVGGNYNPWHGMIFDLGGPSNKVAIFAENDHGPQPCESLEYTVFLSDNPQAKEQVLHPATDGVDPQKWNRAVLSNIYTQGFAITRPGYDPQNPGAVFNAACGDTPEYYVEEDSFVQVFSLPCGITFRYAAIVAGNDGLDFPACAYDSSEGEIDAVAGLSEDGSAVCPDADGDHYVDCACPGAPPVCDCNDQDAAIHPGAPEACDAQADLNCDGNQGTACPSGRVCHKKDGHGVCLTPCTGGENPYCPGESTCQSIEGEGNLCMPNNCGCTESQVCKNGVCVDACQGVVCPGDSICQDGQCFDPCSTIQCPAGQQCHAGQCVFPCGCYAGNVGCSGALVCDLGASNTCVSASCQGVTCGSNETCDPATGTCVSLCNANVHCPDGQKCDAVFGCIPNCQGVTCQDKWTCDPSTGQCKDTSCDGVTCFAPQVCVGGACVTPDGGAGGGGAGGGATGGSGGTPTGTSSGSSSSSGGASAGDKGQCGCRLTGEPDEGPRSAAALALLGIAAAFARRRRWAPS